MWVGCVVSRRQWLKRVSATESGRLNSTAITFTHDGQRYALLLSASSPLQPGRRRTAVSTTARRSGGGGGGGAGTGSYYASRLTVSRVTPDDAGLYVCVVTGRYGVRSYRAAALHVLGQYRSYTTSRKNTTANFSHNFPKC